MTESRQTGKITIALLMIAFLITGLLMSFRSSVEALQVSASANYETTLFDKLAVMQVEISMEESDWQEFLENAIEEKYYECDVTVNGTTYFHSGIRAKGNTSLTMVASSDSDRYSFKIKFDEYVDGQNCDGLSELILNNVFSDASYMKEYLSYDMMAAMGIAVPLYAYSNISVNGENWGLYLALEPMETEYAYRNFGSGYGALYKVESNAGGGERGHGGGNSAAGADGVYINDQISSYSSIFDHAAYDVTKEQQEALIFALKKIKEGADLETYLNVEDTLKYIAANVFLVNLDSYFGSMKHNYYLYEENGQLTMLPWDYNLAFAGFQSNDSEGAVNSPIDSPISGADPEERPFVSKLLENEEYLEQYHEKLQELLKIYFQNGAFEKTVDYLNNLIASYVKQDATAFYSYEEYQDAVETLKTFGKLRALSVQGQLDGTIPSTKEGQEMDSSSLIDASSISIQVMGVQGGGEGKGGGPGGEDRAGKKERGRKQENAEESDANQQAVETMVVSEKTEGEAEAVFPPENNMETREEGPDGFAPEIEGEPGRMQGPGMDPFDMGKDGFSGKEKRNQYLLAFYGLLFLGIGFVMVKKY